MSGKARPSLRRKTLENVRFSNLSETDKQCIYAVFAEKDKVRCKDCRFMKLLGPGYRYCLVWLGVNSLGDDGYCNYGERKDNAKQKNKPAP